MTAVSLFDTLSRDPSHKGHDGSQPRSLAQLAGELVEGSLNDLQRIRRYEERFTPVEWNDHALEVERLINGMLSDWANEATQVLARARQSAAQGFEIPNLALLENSLGHARAQLKLTPEKIAKAMEDVRLGNVIPAKELRDELHARLRS